MKISRRTDQVCDSCSNWNTVSVPPVLSCRSHCLQSHDLGTLGGARSPALAINDNGQIVGGRNTPTSRVYSGKWCPSDLGTLGGLRSEAFAINSRGQIVGYSDVSTATNTSQHPGLWKR